MREAWVHAGKRIGGGIMKRFFCALSIPFIVLLLLFSGCSGISRKAQQGAYGSKTASLAQLVMPENDLYQPVATLPISLLSETSYDLDYQHCYAGFYDVSLITPNMDLDHWYDPKDADFELLITISSNQGNIATHKVESHSKLSGFSSSIGGGVILFRYALPAEYPYDQGLHCHIEIIKPGPDFVAQYGMVTLQITKSSVE